MITVGGKLPDARKPYRDLTAATYDVNGYRSQATAEAVAATLTARKGVQFGVVGHAGRYFAAECTASQSDVYGELVHRVKGVTRWAMVRAGGLARERWNMGVFNV